MWGDVGLCGLGVSYGHCWWTARLAGVGLWRGFWHGVVAIATLKTASALIFVNRKRTNPGYPTLYGWLFRSIGAIVRSCSVKPDSCIRRDTAPETRMKASQRGNGVFCWLRWFVLACLMFIQGAFFRSNLYEKVIETLGLAGFVRPVYADRRMRGQFRQPVTKFQKISGRRQLDLSKHRRI